MQNRRSRTRRAGFVSILKTVAVLILICFLALLGEFRTRSSSSGGRVPSLPNAQDSLRVPHHDKTGGVSTPKSHSKGEGSGTSGRREEVTQPEATDDSHSAVSTGTSVAEHGNSSSENARRESCETLHRLATASIIFGDLDDSVGSYPLRPQLVQFDRHIEHQRLKPVDPKLWLLALPIISFITLGEPLQDPPAGRRVAFTGVPLAASQRLLSALFLPNDGYAVKHNQVALEVLYGDDYLENPAREILKRINMCAGSRFSTKFVPSLDTLFSESVHTMVFGGFREALAALEESSLSVLQGNEAHGRTASGSTGGGRSGVSASLDQVMETVIIFDPFCPSSAWSAVKNAVLTFLGRRKASPEWEAVIQLSAPVQLIVLRRTRLRYTIPREALLQYHHNLRQSAVTELHPGLTGPVATHAPLSTMEITDCRQFAEDVHVKYSRINTEAELSKLIQHEDEQLNECFRRLEGELRVNITMVRKRIDGNERIQRASQAPMDNIEIREDLKYWNDRLADLKKFHKKVVDNRRKEYVETLSKIHARQFGNHDPGIIRDDGNFGDFQSKSLERADYFVASFHCEQLVESACPRQLCQHLMCPGELPTTAANAGSGETKYPPQTTNLLKFFNLQTDTFGVGPVASLIVALSTYSTFEVFNTVAVVDCHPSLIMVGLIAAEIGRKTKRGPNSITVWGGEQCALGVLRMRFPHLAFLLKERSHPFFSPDKGKPSSVAADIVLVHASAFAEERHPLTTSFGAKKVIVLVGVGTVAEARKFAPAENWKIVFSSGVGFGTVVLVPYAEEF